MMALLIRKKEKVSDDWFIPFCIMTSGDIHDGTIELLKKILILVWKKTK